MSGPTKRDLRHAARERRAAARRRTAGGRPVGVARGRGGDRRHRARPRPPDRGCRVAVYESLPDEPPTGRARRAPARGRPRGHRAGRRSTTSRSSGGMPSEGLSATGAPSPGGGVPRAPTSGRLARRRRARHLRPRRHPGPVGRPRTARGSARAAAATTGRWPTATRGPGGHPAARGRGQRGRPAGRRARPARRRLRDDDGPLVRVAEGSLVALRAASRPERRTSAGGSARRHERQLVGRRLAHRRLGERPREGLVPAAHASIWSE